MISLRWKLGGALLLVVLVSVGVMVFLINRNTSSQFQQYIQSGSTAYTQRVVTILQQYYTQQQNWIGVQDILSAALRNTSDRLVLADTSGIIIADTNNSLIGKSASSLGTAAGTSIQLTGKIIGILYSEVNSMGMGGGYMGGRGNPRSTTPTPVQSVVQTTESDLLSSVNRYIWIAGGIAILIALVLGILLTRQITRPLKALNTGAEHISAGDLAYRVKIRTKDEIGVLAASFNTMASKLDSSEQSRRRLVSDVAHELRTPLTIIQGTVDGISDGVLPSDKEHLDNIREQTVLLTHLVNDLRDLSLAESGQLKLDRQPTDLFVLIQRKISQFEVNAQQKNIQIAFNSLTDAPQVNIDSKRIEQVMTNLLSNAIRHNREGGQINIELKYLPQTDITHQSGLLVSVADTGEGIDPEHLPHVFERFYRAESSRSRSHGGVGLGLAIVKQMVEAHGGKVWAESRNGQGSTFYFTLPV